MQITLPPNYTSLAAALISLFGKSATIAQTAKVPGGDINKSYALTMDNGKRIFMKANAKENAPFFTAEAAGISAIAKTGTIGTPEILCTGTDNGEEVGYSFLLLGFIESGKKRADYWEVFAQNLAAMHNADTSVFIDSNNGPDTPSSYAPQQCDTHSSASTGVTRAGASADSAHSPAGAAATSSSDSADGALSPSGQCMKFGFFQDNFIGARPQKNTSSESWISFFRNNRLAPQFSAADRYFTAEDRARNQKLLDHLEDFLVEPEKPSLLHGDLWSGNVMCGTDGNVLLIDPACYVGHAEADLAMTELFGGFPSSFYDAYREARPLQPGYESRRDLYNLYQLLNHLNLFGSGYLNAVKSVVAEYVGL